MTFSNGLKLSVSLLVLGWLFQADSNRILLCRIPTTIFNPLDCGLVSQLPNEIIY